MRQQQGGQRREQYEERLPNLFLVEIGEVRGNRRHPRDYRLSEDAPSPRNYHFGVPTSRKETG